MRTILCLWLIMIYCKTVGYAVASQKPEIPNENNVILITLDGFRWQELFFGADSALINNPKFTKDQSAKNFWSDDYKERRKKLMPFFWSEIASEGQIFGNRLYKNKVNVSNVYALSYPGYNEIFTGTTDFTIFCNQKIKNRNINFFEYANKKTSIRDKVASFTSWSLFPYIFNKSRSGFYINSSNEVIQTDSLITKDDDNNSLRSDFETYKQAKEFIIKNHPRLVHIGLSGTDTYGHRKMYDHYLFQAHLADNIIAGLWELVQSSSFYRDKTTLIITTDHGRGNNINDWDKHGFLIGGSSQTWIAMLGNGVKKIGECKEQVQLYQKQIAGTMGYFLNLTSYNKYSFPFSYFTATNRKTVN
jgi:hypothetical protein